MLKRVQLVLAIAVFLGPVRTSAQVTEPSTPEKEALAELLAENQVLVGQITKAETTKGEIGRAKLSQSGKADALTRGRDELRRLRLGVDREANDITNQANQAGCAWGGSSTDKAYVAGCNTEADRLNGLLEQVKSKEITADQFEQKLNEGQNVLSQTTFTLFQKEKANNADLEELYNARANWQARYNAFVFNSDTYRRLVRMNPASKVCVRIAENMDDASLREAAECLKRLWDGSR